MSVRGSNHLKEMGGRLGVTDGDIIEIRRKRAARRLRIAIGATIAAAAGAASGYYIGLLSPNRPAQSIYPLCIVPLANTIPLWPIRQAPVRRSHAGLTLAGLIVLLVGLMAFFIAYALGVSNPVPASIPSDPVMYGVAYRQEYEV